MTKGESVLVIKDYDLFDENIKGCKGIYIKTDKTTGKYLIYFPINQEWADMTPDLVKRVKPGFVNKKNKDFVKNVKTLSSVLNSRES